MVDRKNVGMVQGRRGPGLQLKTPQPIRILGHIGGQYFDRHFTL